MDTRYEAIIYSWNSCLENSKLALLICTASKGNLTREATWIISKKYVSLAENSSDTDPPFDKEEGWPFPPEEEIAKARELL